jgi:chemotaxis protein CheZ
MTLARVELEPPPLPLTSATAARIGAITRELHEALRALGAAPELQRVIREIPDSRSRLAYVGEMTEQAAHRVLNLVDTALPQVSAYAERAQHVVALLEQGARVPAGEAQGGPGLAAACGAFASDSLEFAERQKQILSDIMLTQDFQDLSGQVIKKVIDMITRTESQLVQLLVDDVDDHGLAPGDSVLQGPQTPDNALQQGDVDDLLASMGF